MGGGRDKEGGAGKQAAEGDKIIYEIMGAAATDADGDDGAAAS